MPSISPMITNFIGGMLSPKYEGRIDLEIYKNAVKTLNNMLVYPAGSVTRRPGTEFIATAACSNHEIKLFSFIFSAEESYILEFGQNKPSDYSNRGYIRFFSDLVNPQTGVTYAGLLHGTGPIECVPNPYTITTSSPWNMGTYWHYNGTDYNFYLGTSSGAGKLSTYINKLYSGVTVTYILNANVLNAGAGPLKFALNTSTNIFAISATGIPGAIYATVTYKFTLSTDTLYVIPATDCSAVVKNISFREYKTAMILDTPYKASELQYLRIAQNADVIYFVHPYYRPYKLSRYSPTAWTFSTYAITEMPADWSDAYGWPTTVVFHQSRLWFGGNFTSPQKVWASVAALYDNFTQGTSVLSAFDFELNSVDTVDRILWMFSHKKMLIGTIGSVWKEAPPSSTLGLSASNIGFTRESSIGVSGNKALLMGTQVMFTGRLGKSICSFFYSWESDGYKSNNLALLSDSLLHLGIKDFVYQQTDNSIVWLLTNDSKLISYTYYPNQNVIAWNQHFTSYGNWESISIIPNNIGGYDELWISTIRPVTNTTGTNNIRYIERLKPLETELNGVANSWYLDCAKKIISPAINVTNISTTHISVGTATIHLLKIDTSSSHNLSTSTEVKFFDLIGTPSGGSYNPNQYNNFSFKVQGITSATSFNIYAQDIVNYTITSGYIKEKRKTISGLDWCKGREITALGDGSPLTAVVVSTTGIAEFQTRFCDAIIGYNYESLIESLKIETHGVSDSIQGHKKRVFSAILRFYNTVGAKFGVSTSDNDLNNVIFRTVNMPMNQPVVLFSGDKLIKSNTGFNREGRIVIKQDQPLPMTVLGIIEDLTIHDI